MSSQVGAMRTLLSERQWLMKEGLLFQVLPKASVPPSRRNPCTYIPGRGSGKCN